jgi:hypothetical protein
MTGTLREHVCIIVIVSRSIFLKMRNVLDKICREIETHILYAENVLRNLTLYEITWESVVESDMS